MMYKQINTNSLIPANILGIENRIKICHMSHNVLFRHMSDESHLFETFIIIYIYIN